MPAATDIAFALAILAVVGSALPSPLRAFLLTLAVVDDLIVIVVIAVFYTEGLHLLPLAGGSSQRSRRTPCCSEARIRTSLVYLPLAAVAWAAMYESGVHATIAGVVLGLLTRVFPTRTRPARRPSGSSTGSPRSARASRCRSSHC